MQKKEKNVVKSEQQLFLLLVEDGLSDLQARLERNPTEFSIEELRAMLILSMETVYIK